jgi:phospholipid/cholesterol/gamma-HCH transport system substrate-binding protein
VNTQAPSVPRILVMVVFALSCFGLLVFLWLSFGGPIPLKPKGYRIQVAFPEATQLAVEADVRSSGVAIGKVRAKRRDPGSSRTLATLEIERRYAPIRSDARAVLRSKTLLGETFVEMTQGSKRAPFLEEGARLPDNRVQASVELDEILDSLDPFTRAAFRTWQQDLGRSVQGRGRDLNDSFGNLPGFVESGGDLFETLDQQRAALKGLVKNTGVVFGALTRREDQLRNLITTQDDVFSAIAAEQEAFADAWQVFPTFLDESRATATRLESFSRKALPLVRDMQPALRDLDPTLDSVGDFAPHLRRFFRDFDPLITISKRSLPATAEIFDELRPTLAELVPFLQQVNPILEYIGVHQYTLSDMFANLGVATAARTANPGEDQLGHYLRQFGPSGAETAAIHPKRVATNRGNAYPNPLGVLSTPEGAEYKVLPSFDCNNSGVKKPTTHPPASPGCRLQKGFPFKGGTTGRYPRLQGEDYGAGG